MQGVVRALPKPECDGLVLELARSVGWHPLCVLDETSVRDGVRALHEGEGEASGEITDGDLQRACAHVARHSALSEEFGAALSDAVDLAIASARERSEMVVSPLAQGQPPLRERFAG